MEPTAKRAYSDAEAVELIRTVRARRPWPRPPVWAFWTRVAADACLIGSALAVSVTVWPTRRAAFATVGPASAWIWALPISLFVAWFVLRLVASRGCQRLRRRALRAGGIACLNCHYRLESLKTDDASEHVCPECREPYRPSEVRREWDAWQPGVWFY